MLAESRSRQAARGVLAVKGGVSLRGYRTSLSLTNSTAC